jgi:predicted nucleotidyltransferase
MLRKESEKMPGLKKQLPEKIEKEISEYARKYNISKVTLFGSRARGTNTERSDIDIAVKGGDFDGFYWEIKENLNSLLMVDIVDLNDNISAELRAELDRDGVTIYEKT